MRGVSAWGRWLYARDCGEVQAMLESITGQRCMLYGDGDTGSEAERWGSQGEPAKAGGYGVALSPPHLINIARSLLLGILW